MALKSNEKWETGFVVDKNTGQPVVTFDKTGAKWETGFLRDPDGRLVVTNG